MRIPWIVEDISFSQFLDIKAIEKKHGKDNFIDVMIEVAEMWLGDVSDMPFGDAKEVRTLKLTEVITVSGFYMHIIALIKEGADKAEKEAPTYIEHDGERYYFREESIETIQGIAFSTGQVVEVLHYQDLFNRMADKIKEGEVWDANCAFEFELGIREVSILCLKEGEKLPWKPAELKAFISNRMLELEGLDMQQVLNVRFFFLNGIREYVRTLITEPSLRGLVGRRGTRNLSLKQRRKLNSYLIERAGGRSGLTKSMIKYFIRTLKHSYSRKP